MGGSYTSFVTKGTTSESVTECLRKAKRNAIVVERDKAVLFFDEEADEADTDVIKSVGATVSAATKCPVLAVVVHDDDVLGYFLVVGGKTIDEYNSNPAYFDFEGTMDTSPTKPNFTALCNAFKCKNTTLVKKILSKSLEDDDAYAFETDRHKDLLVALDLPGVLAGHAFTNLSEGDSRGDFTKQELNRVKARKNAK